MPRLARSRLVLVAVILALLTPGATPAADTLAGSSCPLERDGPNVAQEGTTIWTSPRDAAASEPIRVLVVADDEPPGELVVFDPTGQVVTLTTVTRTGPPWSLESSVQDALPGVYRLEVRRDGATVSCRQLAVGGSDEAQPGRAAAQTGAPSRTWDRATEAFYSAWIARLFDAPPDDDISFRPLHDALRDPERNFLHDHLDLGEDDAGSPRALIAKPDCADLPYFLRAYFAWKLALPFGFRRCSRGSAAAAPRCGPLMSSDQAGSSRETLASFKSLAHRVMDAVHSGNARAALADDATDFYPVALEREAIRPGVIYADPYGHTLVVVGWVPQTPERSGMLFAVDAQPDTSVGRKRFWEGTFLFADGKASGAGFKAFRPIVGERAGGPLRPLSNAALADYAAAPPISEEQAHLSPDEFYARVGQLINPKGLDPAQAYAETLDALVEQLEARVKSVDNGEQHMRTQRDDVVPMPEGASIFETTGPWEDYATPSRDMRLIIAMNVLSSLPDRIVEHPDLYVLDGRNPADAATEVKDLHARQASERAITYTRSDGSPWKLTVADVLARKAAFEIAYNPNDCAEVRWGAAEGTPEYAPCARRAPGPQRARMAQYRPWFREARRPPR